MEEIVKKKKIKDQNSNSKEELFRKEDFGTGPAGGAGGKANSYRAKAADFGSGPAGGAGGKANSYRAKAADFGSSPAGGAGGKANGYREKTADFGTGPAGGAGGKANSYRAKAADFGSGPAGPDVQRANKILAKYKRGKASLDGRLIESEEWWKLRQWNTTRRTVGSKTDPMYAGAQLWNCITSKHAEAMDGYPEPNVRPRMPDDRLEAKMLTDVLPVILERNDFLRVYSDHWWALLKKGTGVYGCFWDGGALGGLGDIAIREVDLLRLSWQPGVTDIQDSENVFYETLTPDEELIARWPRLEGRLHGAKRALRSYRRDDSWDTSESSVLVDWYYKKRRGGRVIVHLAQFVGDELLFSTEADPAAFPNGIYDHGMYPFIVQPLFPVEGSIAGYGYCDVGRQYQEQIDVLNQALVKNAAFGAKPRFFVREDGSVSETEFADPESDLVHVGGNLGEDSIRQIRVAPFPEVALRLLNSKIDELKEVTGNRDVTNGGVAGGVTAASAIAALQEASGKISRDANLMAYDAYRRLILMCIELIRQFYGLPRWFMIRGRDAAIGAPGLPAPEYSSESFVRYDNSRLVPQPYAGGYRLPVFDVRVDPQRATPYTKMAQNELALQLLAAGFFSPGNERVALAALDMMDFTDKDRVAETIIKNYLQSAEGFMEGDGENAPGNRAEKGIISSKLKKNAALNARREHPIVARARENARAATQVRQ